MKKELLEEFTSAKWKTQEDIRSFVARAGEITSEDVGTLLDILTGKRVSVGSTEQANRARIFAELAEKPSLNGLSEPFLRALKSDDRHLRAALVPLIPKADTPQLRPKICELLKSSDTHLRRTVVQILQKIKDPNVVRFIAEMYKDRNFPGGSEAIDIAGALPGHPSVELLRMVIATGKTQEKIKTLKLLSGPNFLSGRREVVQGVVQPALYDGDESVKTEAITCYAGVCTEMEYFDSVGSYLYGNSLRLIKAAVEGLRHFKSERTMAALERKLFTGPNMVRIIVLDCVEHMGGSCIHNVLLKALEHRNSSVRERASEVLARLTADGKINIGEGKIQVADAVLWLLRSKDPNVKQMAVKLAGSLPDTSQLWGEVLDLLRNENWWVRQGTIETFAEMAGENLVPHAAQLLADPSETFRRFALDLLLQVKSPQSLGPLQDTALKDENWWVREKAIFVLSQINLPQVVPFITEIAVNEPALRVVVVDALREMGATASAPQVASFVTSEDPDVRYAALRCLDSFGDNTFAASIQSCTKDLEPRVRHLATEIAGKWSLARSAEGPKDELSLPVIDRLLIRVKLAEADDLILLPDNVPYVKKHGKTIPLLHNRFTSQQVQSILLPVLSQRQKEDLRNLRDVDFSYEVRSEGLRFRANIFTCRTGISAVFRIIKGDLWRLEDLGLPSVVTSFGDFKHGLVLVGGPTGSGKSTTLSTIIAHINRTSRRHVISIEDPIEAIHKSDMGLVNQREVGVHTPSFDQALRMTLREDPDVILVGEMRDLPTIQFAVTAAETGHLVFGTVHTVSADSTVDRLINAYPPEAQEQVRSMLADSLRAVLCQYLIRHKDMESRVLASELMINNNAISNLIRKGKTFQIPSVIATSGEQQMQMMDTSLMDLYKQGKITAEDAYLKARNKADFEEIIGNAK